MPIGALGCNPAWGLVDAVMYLMATLVERGRRLALHRRLRVARDEQELAVILGEEMPPLLGAALVGVTLARGG